MKPRDKINNLPEQPGVYIFKDSAGKDIYIGKAKNIRDRVLGHFRNSGDVKEERLTSSSVDIEYIVTDSEPEALILEAELVKKRQPRYNILLKDDKKFPWIKITSEPYPRIFSTRNLNQDGSRLFGPYTDSTALNRTLALVKQIFPVRTCLHPLPNKKPSRPCLNHQIGRCLAPCQGRVSPEEYRTMIDAIVKYISGRNRELVHELEALRDAAAKQLDFEQAAHWRDQLQNLEKVIARQKIVFKGEMNADFIALARLKKQIVITVLSFRGGRLVARYDRAIEDPLGVGDPELLASFISQHYLSSLTIPDNIILETLPEDRALLEEVMRNFKGTRVSLKLPSNNTEKKLLAFAQKQLKSKMEELVAGRERLNAKTAKPLIEVQQALGLDKLPRLMTAFDISNISGTDSVGSAVCFKDARPYKAGYRHFKIRINGPNDTAMIKETVGRYLDHVMEAKTDMPDLILVDGGLPQLNSALQSKREKGYNIPMAGLAKRMEELFLEDGSVVSLPRNSSGLHLMQRLRDEAHRFAQRYHHALRAKRAGNTRLISIKGVGPGISGRLLRKFGSVKRISSASQEALAEVVGATMASRILQELEKSR
ncbi:MAG: excinuclease ABC subunit UvrC [Candidatus Edwardsbacteria bacterium]|nr:excinuclease ABC subunit UvrC [Candidatus Edwardsbacteria bacterium]MBU1576947.1 excinuclease ABC subunit UvrC [Candidatus Edwardsbacteria bacterium]MBU2463313.1 excinuclease ABC subunit UvrC [Candidatus Edwardsbacteria bacterium]MBU2593738.1 excinuclease ABC subunit UvrC [Candidatus Edwardsbacteria bacterium]